MNRRHHITAPAAQATALVSECPALALLTSLATISAEYERMELVKLSSVRDGWSQTLCSAAMEDAHDIEGAIRERLASVKACSFEGAAAQMGELLVRLSFIEDEPTTEESRRAQFRAARRLIFSVLHVIEDAGGFTVNDVAGSNFVNGVLDPWESVDKRKAAVDAVRPVEEHCGSHKGSQ